VEAPICTGLRLALVAAFDGCAIVPIDVPIKAVMTAVAENSLVNFTNFPPTNWTAAAFARELPKLTQKSDLLSPPSLDCGRTCSYDPDLRRARRSGVAAPQDPRLCHMNVVDSCRIFDSKGDTDSAR
jgi:hypothetical protein